MIIHRAFIREVLHTCAAVTAILFSIFLVIRLAGFLNAVAEDDIALESVLVLLLLKMMTYLDIIVPLVMYISILLVMGRWIRDHELTVINACGISIQQFLKPIAALSIVLGAIVGAFSLYLSPLAAEAGKIIEFEHRNRSDVTGIVPGVFTEIRNGSGVYFVAGYDTSGDTFQDIFVYNAGEEDDAVVIARSGFKIIDEKTSDDFLVLENGTQYQGTAGSENYMIIDFEKYAIRLKDRSNAPMRLPVKAIPTLSLLANPLPGAIAEFHWRITKIVILPALMLFAMSFSSISYRRARFPGMIAALLVYFAYINILGIAVALIRREAVHPHGTLWLINLGFLLLAAVMFKRRSEDRRMISGLSS